MLVFPKSAWGYMAAYVVTAVMATYEVALLPVMVIMFLYPRVDVHFFLT